MKNILTLDLGTTTGWAAGNPETVVHGTWNLKPGRHDGGGMRFVKFRQRLAEVRASLHFDAVFYEEVRRHVGTDAAHVYGGLMATLTSWCEEHAIPYQGIPVGTIKKYATGRGNAPKEQMVEVVRSWGHEVADDNEADAVALFFCQAQEIGLCAGPPKKVIPDSVRAELAAGAKVRSKALYD